MDFNISETKEADRRVARLSGELTVYQVARALPGLLELLESPEELVLDLSAVQGLDTAGLQALVVFQREARSRSIGLVFTEHSSAMLRALDLFGLAGYFDGTLDREAAAGQGFALAYGTDVHPERELTGA